MTYSEKALVMEALHFYAEKLDRDIQRYKKRGETDKADEAFSTKCTVKSLFYRFGDLLDTPDGQARI